MLVNASAAGPARSGAISYHPRGGCMTIRGMALILGLILAVAVATLHAADPTGRWAATFNTEVGEQQYTFEFVVKGTTLTGTAKGNLLGESQIAEGKIDGDKISFVENASFMEMPLRIVYTGRSEERRVGYEGMSR